MCYAQGRRYYTRDEKRQYLEGYAEELENELKAVKERIQELSGGQQAA